MIYHLSYLAIRNISFQDCVVHFLLRKHWLRSDELIQHLFKGGSTPLLPPRLSVFLYQGWANWSPTARNIPPSQPSARQDALFPERGPSDSFYLSLGEWPRLPSTARINDPSKLARYSSHGMAPVLVPLRPSSEHILIVRAPGARDRHGCHSTPFIVRVLRARRAPGRSPSSSYTRAGCEAGWAGQR